MLTTLEKLQPNTPTKPISHILANYFQKFINYWTHTDVRFLGELQEGIVDMPVEICVRWKGNAQGTMIIRCYEDFLIWFNKNKSYKPLNVCTGKEMLYEMIGEYCIYVVCNFWNPKLLEIGPLLPRPCRLEDWSDQTAEAAFGVLVNNHPIEIRFWME
jgi:hypothetical protein